MTVPAVIPIPCERVDINFRLAHELSRLPEDSEAFAIRIILAMLYSAAPEHTKAKIQYFFKEMR